MKIFLTTAALLGTAVSAQAADLAARPYTKAPAYVAVYDWTGFYFGANAGVGIGRDRADHIFPSAASSFATTYLSPQGGLGGGQVGYNWQTNSILGPMVIGVEGDIQGTDMRDSRTTLNSGGGVSQYNQKLDWFATARGRVGLATGPVLSYVTAGYAYGNVKTGIVENGASVLSTSRGQSGWTVGSGVEASLGGNWTGKIEYLYLNLGNKTDTFALGTQALNTEIRENIFRVGLNYRINGKGTPAIVAANWTGFYLGGNIGSGTGRDRSSVAAGGVTELYNLAPDGINGGVQAGYNWQAGNVVFGVETDIQASSQQDNKTCVALCNPGLVFAKYDATLPWFGTVRGRLGYSVGSTLFYATGGYAYGGVKTKIASNLLPSDVSLSKTKGGYAVGGGIETPFSLLGLFGPNWTSKTEYLYVDLGSTSDAFATLAGPAVQTTKVTEHIFRTGLNYHFNTPVVAKY